MNPLVLPLGRTGDSWTEVRVSWSGVDPGIGIFEKGDRTKAEKIRHKKPAVGIQAAFRWLSQEGETAPLQCGDMTCRPGLEYDAPCTLERARSFQRALTSCQQGVWRWWGLWWLSLAITGCPSSPWFPSEAGEMTAFDREGFPALDSALVLTQLWAHNHPFPQLAGRRNAGAKSGLWPCFWSWTDGPTACCSCSQHRESGGRWTGALAGSALT